MMKKLFDEKERVIKSIKIITNDAYTLFLSKLYF